MALITQGIGMMSYRASERFHHPAKTSGTTFWAKGHPRNLVIGCQKLLGSKKKWKNGMAIISAIYQGPKCSE